MSGAQRYRRRGINKEAVGSGRALKATSESLDLPKLGSRERGLGARRVKPLQKGAERFGPSPRLPGKPWLTLGRAASGPGTPFLPLRE